MSEIEQQEFTNQNEQQERCGVFKRIKDGLKNGLKKTGRIIADNKGKIITGFAVLTTAIATSIIAEKFGINDDDDDIFDEKPFECEESLNECPSEEPEITE